MTTAAQGQDLGLDQRPDQEADLGTRLAPEIAVVTDTARQAPMMAPTSTNGDVNENNDPAERINTMNHH